MVYAHGGRTDANGGHKDNKNTSVLGPYHYHCGGYPAHLHNGGICPYTSLVEISISSSSETSTTNSKTTSTSALATAKSTEQEKLSEVLYILFY